MSDFEKLVDAYANVIRAVCVTIELNVDGEDDDNVSYQVRQEQQSRAALIAEYERVCRLQDCIGTVNQPRRI